MHEQDIIKVQAPRNDTTLEHPSSKTMHRRLLRGQSLLCTQCGNIIAKIQIDQTTERQHARKLNMDNTAEEFTIDGIHL